MYEHSRKLNARVCNRVIQAWSEAEYSVHIRQSDPPCICRRNKECLLFNPTLALRSFTPNFSDSSSLCYDPYSPPSREAFSLILYCSRESLLRLA